MKKRSGLRSDVPGLFFILAVALALGIIIYAGTQFSLDATGLMYTAPVEYCTGWSIGHDGGGKVLDEVSRSAAGAEHSPLIISNTLPDDLLNDAALCIQTKNELIMAFVNDEPIYTYGYGDVADFGWEYGAVWNIIQLPADAAGAEVRLELTPISGRTGEAPYEIYVGCSSSITSFLFQQKLHIAIVCILMLLISLGFFFVGIVETIRGVSSASSMRMLSYFIMLAAMWTAADGLLFQFIFNNKAVSYYIFNTSFLLLPVPFTLFVRDLAPRHRRFYNALALETSAYFFLRIVLYLMGVLNFEQGLIVIHLFMAVIIMYTVAVLFKDRKNPASPKGMFFALIVLALIDLIALVRFYTNDMLDVQRADYSTGFYFGILIFSLYMIYDVIRRGKLVREQALKAVFFERRAYTDELTGLSNSHGFDDKAAVLIRKHPERCYAVLTFDLNYFPQYTASLGTEAGNALLVRIANMLSNAQLDDELCARLEADHFAALMHGADMTEIARRVVETNESFSKEMVSRRLLVSHGLVEVTDVRVPVATLRSQADIAKSTVAGNFEKNVAIFNAHQHRRQIDDIAMINDLPDALKRGEYLVYLQPKFDILGRTVAGAEALARRLGPNNEILSPDTFIPLFELHGAVGRLDLYVFEQVCVLQRELMNAGFEPVPVSVNFSRVHLFTTGFAEQLSAIAARHGVPPRYLEIELTESAFVVQFETLRDTIDRLHDAGFSISIDDFGSGYSSLNMLKGVEIDAIKLDRAFLEESSDSRGETVMRGILELAERLRIVTVAEGVETEEQLMFLSRSGCNIAQGFLFSRPIPREDFVRKYYGDSA